MQSIEVRDLAKTFAKAVRALDGVDVSARSGECLVLLGPSHSGKSTLLRVIAGLERPDAGHVLIGGRIVDGMRPRRREVAMVFSSYALYPHKTALGNITIPLKPERLSRHMRQRRARWAARLAGLDPRLLECKPHELPASDRRRVALARAVVSDPEALLLDDLLGDLEPSARGAALDELRTFQRRAGVTAVSATRDHAEAMVLGDRIAVLHDGRLRQAGTPREIYDDPADTFVATLLGTPPMNLVPRGDRLVGFRPEHLLPAENVTMGSRATMPLTIERVAYLSGDRHVYGSVHRIGSETRVVARVPANVTTPLPVGQTHDFAVPVDRLRFFDASRGTRAAPVRMSGV